MTQLEAIGIRPIVRFAHDLVAATRRPGTWLALGVGVALCALFAWEVNTTPSFVVDDSYITFAFSKNLARGLGPTYGQGIRVEGYSNFLWMVIVALPLVIAPHGDPVLLSRIMTVPFVGLLFAGTFLLARVRAGRFLSCLAVALVAMDVNVVLAFDSGLETLPYVALIVAGFAAYVRGDRAPLFRRAVVPLFTAAALTRIDGFVPLGFIIAFDAARAWSNRRFSIVALLRFALPGLGVWALWFAWRWSYYGLPLPSTYYAKALIPDLMPRRGSEYVQDELIGSGLFLALPAFAFLLWRRRKATVPVGLFAIGQVLYAAKVGGDWMPSARFVLPAFPLFIALLVAAGQELFDAARRRGPGTASVTFALTLGLLFWVGVRAEPHQTTLPYVGGKLGLTLEQEKHVAILRRGAEYLAAVVPKGGRLVTDYGGILAYYTDANPIEMWGLCNATIATRGNADGIMLIYGRTCPECYPELDPEYFHTYQPLVRDRDTFLRHEDVIGAVWQTDTIGRYLDFVHGFASGRVVHEQSGKAVWFLEKRGAGWKPHPRRVGAFVVEYPFNENGLFSN